MRRLPFNDEWILENHERFASYRELAEEHNKLFGTDFSREQMKNHAGLFLKVRMGNYWYTPEMKEWIRREYPKTGTSEEKAARFNEAFGTNKAAHSVRQMAYNMGVVLSDEAHEEYARKSAEHLAYWNSEVRGKPIGFVGRPANGYLMVKTGKGTWMPQGRYEYELAHGKIEKGHVVIFLDGDNTNVSPDNLMAVPQACQILMTTNGFWSEEPNLTKAGAVWSELYLLLNKRRRNDQQET